MLVIIRCICKNEIELFRLFTKESDHIGMEHSNMVLNIEALGICINGNDGMAIAFNKCCMFRATAERFERKRSGTGVKIEHANSIEHNKIIQHVKK